MSTACSEEQRKREERNRKQREYRARKRAQETNEEREERNKRQHEYHARRNAETSALSNALDQPGALSSLILRAIRIHVYFCSWTLHYLLQQRRNIQRL
jgi:hypothetical protein